MRQRYDAILAHCPLLPVGLSLLGTSLRNVVTGEMGSLSQILQALVMLFPIILLRGLEHGFFLKKGSPK
jgi:hypothetical protein